MSSSSASDLYTSCVFRTEQNNSKNQALEKGVGMRERTCIVEDRCTLCEQIPHSDMLQKNKKDPHLPCRRSGLTTPSSMSVAVTMEQVMGSSSSRLISAKESDIPSFPITTCFVFFSCTRNRHPEIHPEVVASPCAVVIPSCMTFSLGS